MYDCAYGYATHDINLAFGAKPGDDSRNSVKFDNFTLPQFKRTSFKLITSTAVTSSGSYVRLIIRLRLTRQLGFYLMNIIIPSILIVMISWISFWLSRSASPARVSIGVTTVLTLVTLISTTNSQLPKVSYVKSLDIFLNFSFVMVFISLVEFSVVSYMAKKLEQRRDKKRRLQEQIQNAEIPMFGTYPHNKMIASPELPSDCDCKTIPLIQAPRFVPDNIMWPAPFAKAKKATSSCRTITPSKIDKLSRSIFPLIYIVFNDAFSTKNIHLSWCNDPSVNDSKKGCGSVHKIDSGITLSNFEIVNACVNKSTAVTSTGSYDRLFVLFRFRRQPGFYMIQSLIPAAVLVMLSFISFYISKNSAPSRTSFVMAFLALTHLFCGTNRKIHVAYLKASDVYLMTCLLIVASVLAEYAIVSFTSRVYEGRLKRKNEKNPIGLRPSAPDPLHDIRLGNQVKNDLMEEVCTCPNQPVVCLLFLSQKSKKKFPPCMKHSSIDLVSRILYPFVFIVFNIVFFTFLYKKLGDYEAQELENQRNNVCI